MTEVTQRYHTQCPYLRAKTYLAAQLGPLADGEGSERLTLSAPVANGVGGSTLVKDVDVTFARAVDPMHFDQPWAVRWTPHGGGPYPSFNGTLTVRGDEDWNLCVLELTGAYQPPLGIAGQAFDALFGSRLALATARELLRKLGEQLVERYRAEEAAKGGVS